MNPIPKKLFVDTNIFLRYLTRDDPVQFPRCRALFKKAQDGELQLVTSTLVIAEIIWTLDSFFQVPKDQILEKVSIIIGSDAVQVPDKDLIAEALVLYGRKNIDYADAYNAILMKSLRLPAIVSYDRDFDKIEGIRRMDP